MKSMTIIRDFQRLCAHIDKKGTRVNYSIHKCRTRLPTPARGKTVCPSTHTHFGWLYSNKDYYIVKHTLHINEGTNDEDKTPEGKA